MKTSELPDELVISINTLLRLHKLSGDDPRSSTIGFIAQPRQWLLGGSYPIDVTEVISRLASAGANVTPIRERIAEIDSGKKAEAENREKLRASAAKKLTKEERKAVGLE